MPIKTTPSMQYSLDEGVTWLDFNTTLRFMLPEVSESCTGASQSLYGCLSSEGLILDLINHDNALVEKTAALPVSDLLELMISCEPVPIAERAPEANCSEEMNQLRDYLASNTPAANKAVESLLDLADTLKGYVNTPPTHGFKITDAHEGSGVVAATHEDRPAEVGEDGIRVAPMYVSEHLKMYDKKAVEFGAAAYPLNPYGTILAYGEFPKFIGAEQFEPVVQNEHLTSMAQALVACLGHTYPSQSQHSALCAVLGIPVPTK